MSALIQYGIDRKYNANETHTALIYNMGATSTKGSRGAWRVCTQVTFVMRFPF